jgi:cytochrome P450
MQNNCEILITALCNAGEGGTKPVNIQNFFLAFTMDTFIEVGFGVQSKSLDPSGKDEWKEFGSSFDGLQVLCPSRMFRPTWPVQRFLSKLALRGWPVGFLCGSELTIAKMQSVVDSTLNRIIEQRSKAGALNRRDSVTSASSRVASPDGSPRSRGSPGTDSPKRRRSMSKYDETKRLDLLELFLDVKPPYSKDELRDVIKSLLVGGRDTTAISLTWAFFEIARHPEIEKKCIEEVKSIPEDDAPAFYAASKGWKYIDAVARETIRLYSPVPIDAKHAVDDDVLPDGTFIGKGWITVYSPYIMARDSDLWGPDAATWRPERWFEGNLATQEPSPFMMSSFQAGPRICLGKDLAIFETKAVIAQLLHSGIRMRLWPSMGKEVPKYQMGVTMQVAEPGMLMKIELEKDEE